MPCLSQSQSDTQTQSQHYKQTNYTINLVPITTSFPSPGLNLSLAATRELAKTTSLSLAVWSGLAWFKMQLNSSHSPEYRSTRFSLRLSLSTLLTLTTIASPTCPLSPRDLPATLTDTVCDVRYLFITVCSTPLP